MRSRIRGKRRDQKNAPRFDVQNQLYRMTGVDLTRIDGVDGPRDVGGAGEPFGHYMASGIWHRDCG